MDLARLERAFRTFVRCHDVVAAAKTEDELFERVCEVAVHELGFKLAWVGLVRDGDSWVHPVGQAGYELGYLESAKISWADGEYGQGPTGRAIRTRATCVARDIATDPRFSPWRTDAVKRGYASSAAVPLTDGAKCLGALNLYAPEPNAFDDDEIALLEEMAVDLVLGMLRLRTQRELDRLEARAAGAENSETAMVVAAGLAHDVTNLLQVVMASIENARAAANDEEREIDLDEASRATTSMTSIMRQFLSLTRRTVETASGWSNVDLVVSGMKELLSRVARKTPLEIQLGAAGLLAKMPPTDVERILINLVVNAAQAGREGSPIAIATGLRAVADDTQVSSGPLRRGDHIVLTVTDRGSGISAEVLPKIFEPFFSTKGQGGSGLGLHSVLHAARAAGGAVSVDSHVGAGTAVSVFVPVAAPP